MSAIRCVLRRKLILGVSGKDGLRFKTTRIIGIFLFTYGSSYGDTLIQNACHILNRRPAQLTQLGVVAQDATLDLLPSGQP